MILIDDYFVMVIKLSFACIKFVYTTDTPLKLKK